MIAVPELVLADEVLSGGFHAGQLDLVGPSIQVDVDAGVLDEGALLSEPTTLVDFSGDIAPFLTPVESADDAGSLDLRRVTRTWICTSPGTLGR